jgi:hypothetical protein
MRGMNERCVGGTSLLCDQLLSAAGRPPHSTTAAPALSCHAYALTLQLLLTSAEQQLLVRCTAH